MQLEESKVSRRKMAGWLGIIALFTTVGAAFTPWKSKKNKTVKMLTQDGKLVEVEESLLTSGRKRITDNELKNWVKHK